MKYLRTLSVLIFVLHSLSNTGHCQNYRKIENLYLGANLEQVKTKNDASYLRVILRTNSTSGDSLAEFYKSGAIHRQCMIKEERQHGEIVCKGLNLLYHESGKLKAELDYENKRFFWFNEQGNKDSIRLGDFDENHVVIKQINDPVIVVKQVYRTGIRASKPTHQVKPPNQQPLKWGSPNLFFRNNYDTCASVWVSDTLPNFDSLQVNTYLHRYGSHQEGYYGLIFANSDLPRFYHFYLKNDKNAGIGYDFFNKSVVNFGDKALNFFSLAPNRNYISMLITPETITSRLNHEFVTSEPNSISYHSGQRNYIGIRICRTGSVKIGKVEVVKYLSQNQFPELKRILRF